MLKALAKPFGNDSQDWIDRGLIFIDCYDDGAGWKHVRTPLWTLKSTYWWKLEIPGRQDGQGLASLQAKRRRRGRR